MPLGLRKPYIQVKRNSGELTYGGDQGFFKDGAKGSLDERKNAMGCGVVAFSDLLLYLGNDSREKVIPENESYVNRINTQEAYREYYNSIYHFLGGVSRKSGISGVKLAARFNRLARREGWKLRARWGLSVGKLYSRVEEMLRRDIPVILCIPMMLLKKDQGDGLTFYREEEGKLAKACTVSAHYVMVTGIIPKDGISFFEISSWGKKYYVNWKEYDSLVRTHFLGAFLGNIMYIK